MKMYTFREQKYQPKSSTKSLKKVFPRLRELAPSQDAG